MKVVYVADIDLMIPAFLRIRARPDEQEDIQWEFENVTFLLNVIDVLADDTEYIDIRKRKPHYATLQVVESRVEEARDREFAKRVEFQAKYEKAVEEAEDENEKTLEKFQSIVNDLQKKQSEGEEINEAELREKMQRLSEQQEVLRRRLAIKKQRLEREREREVKTHPARCRPGNPADAVHVQVLGGGDPLDSALPGRARGLRPAAAART